MQDRSALPAGWKLWLAIALAVCAVLMICTRTYDYIDSFNYALHIVEHSSKAADPLHDPFWDFGHPLWRPLGYVVWNVFRSPLDAAFPTDPALGAGLGLIGISVVSGLVSTVLLFLLLARATGKAWVAGFTTIGFLATDAVINTSASGVAYMLGAACQIGGIYVIFRAIQLDRLTINRGLLAGVLFGLSIGDWFPYCLAIPGFLCFGLLWPRVSKFEMRARLRMLLSAAVATGVVVALIYVVILAEAHATTIAQAREWATRSRYGIIPTLGYIRMIAGIVRGFFYLGQDAVTWKRALWGDGGTHPGIGAILATGIWKVVVVYLVLGWLVLRMWRGQRNRSLLISLAVTALPILYFAAFLFDPGPVIRYYPVFPLLFLGFACVLAEASGQIDKAIPIVFFGLMLAANTHSMWRTSGYHGLEDAVARLNTINPHLTSNDRVWVVSFPDSIVRFVTERPFDPMSRYRYIFHPVLEQGTNELPFWRRHVADISLDCWSHGGHVWVSTRLLAAAPQPDWGWVEGDDTRVKWRTLPSFFETLDLSPPIGGADGFVELTPTDKNKNALHELTAN